MKPFSRLIYFLFPPQCVVCSKSGFFLCAGCLDGIPRLTQQPLSHENLYSLYSYKTPAIQKLITLSKYRGVFSALEVFVSPLAALVFELENKTGIYNRPIVLVPISSTKKSVRLRGFSQTEVLANYIAKEYLNDFTVSPILVRTRKNKKQTECISRSERIENMRDVFAIKNKTLISPEVVYILIDDVITTGATMRAAQDALTKSGARTVIGISIAYQTLT